MSLVGCSGESVPTDNIAPVFNIPNSPITLEVGEAFEPLQYVSATDNTDGDVTSQIVVNSSTVNTETAGEYLVIYEVSDTSGNQMQTTLNITVVEGLSTLDYGAIESLKLLRSILIDPNGATYNSIYGYDGGELLSYCVDVTAHNKSGGVVRKNYYFRLVSENFQPYKCDEFFPWYSDFMQSQNSWESWGESSWAAAVEMDVNKILESIN